MGDVQFEWVATRFMTEPPPPPQERLPDALHKAKSRRAVEPGDGTEGQVHVGPVRQEPTRAGRTRQQGREGTLGRPL